MSVFEMSAPRVIETMAANTPQEQYGYVKGPNMIMFDITQRCNMRCMHCYNFSNCDLTMTCLMSKCCV